MASSQTENTRSIAQVNRMLRNVIESETLEQYFWVGGKIDRCHLSDLGHYYFDLVDDKTRIRCMLPDKRRGNIPFDLEKDLEVEVYGDLQFYERGSQVQIQVRQARLQAPSDFVKPAIDRLRDQGLYPPQRINPPARIRRIACITGRSSRAIGDFETAYRGAGERAVLAPLSWQYVFLEGERAISSLVDAMRALDSQTETDAIALIRGGGRSEDFAAFNSYEVAKAICQCQTYLITGIGHHRDQTLADQMADHATSTPTAAAHHLATLCLKSGKEVEVKQKTFLKQTAPDTASKVKPTTTVQHWTGLAWQSSQVSEVKGKWDQEITQPMKTATVKPMPLLLIVISALAVVAAALLFFLLQQGI